MSQQVIKRTQETLGKYVSKPPLSDKLLGKPPFRYLHDILNVVIKEHGFLAGLFTDQELVSDNIKDKDAKIAFLQKAIDATSLAVGETINVRPSKIVAGHEAENTNLLLQAVAKAIENHVDSSDAVQQVLSQSKTPKKEKKKSEPKKEKPSTKAKAPTGVKETPKKRPSGSKSPPRSTPQAPKKTAPTSKPPQSRRESLAKDSKSQDKSKSKDKRDSSKSKTKDPKSEKEKKPIKESDGKPRPKSKTPEVAKPSIAEPPLNEGKENAPPPGAANMIDDEADDFMDMAAGSEELVQPALPKSAGSVKSGIFSEEVVEETFADEVGNPSDDQVPTELPEEEGNLMGGDPFIELNQVEPSDSGVGSLESPKDTGKVESLPNEAEAKAFSPVPIPPTPGPRPPTLRAYHPDLPDDDLGRLDAADTTSFDEAPPERPKTGMGVRPRTGRKSARPPSARPAPPKVRDRREVPQEEAPRPPTGKPIPNVILLDSENKDEDEDENFTVGTVAKSLLDEEVMMESAMDPELEKKKQDLLDGDQEAKGILVAQILETKKELEDDRRNAFSPETPGHRRVPIEQAFPGDVSRKKEKELIQKDVEKLTSSIQALTRSVNPLAKMLDYLQEDFDSMQKELETWRTENKTLTQSLKSEQSLTEQQLEPLKAQLEDMEMAIYEQHDRISAVKAVILRNEDRIARLLAGINIKS